MARIAEDTERAAVAPATGGHRLVELTPPGRYLTANDGLRLHCLHWPARTPRPHAALVFVHGIASHGAWFAETADFLAGQGITTYAADRRGSGRSEGPRGHVADWHQALLDLRKVVGLAAAEQPDAPLFLVGSSWGAKLAVVYAAMRPGDLAGLLLLGPGLVPRINLKPSQKLGVLFGHLTRPRSQVPIPLTPEMYTANPTYREFIREDPLRLLTASKAFFWLTSRLDRKRDALAPGLDLPLLVQMGEADEMMDVESTRGWFDAVGTVDKTFITYPGAGHTLDFEPDPAQYRNDLAGWLLAHSPTAEQPKVAARVPVVSPTRIERIEAWEVDLPFRFSFGHALASRASSRNLVVAVHLAGGEIGYGEGVPREYVTGETPESALTRVRDEYGPALIGHEIQLADVAADVRSLRDELHAGHEPPGAAWCAVETALLDAAGRAIGRSASDFLGGLARPRAIYSGVIPFGHGKGLLAMLALCRAYGLPTVKLKVGQGEEADLETLRIARRVLAPDVELRVDANCAWTADETLRMAELLRPFGVRAYEQPVPADDLAGMKRLAVELPEDVIADEALCTMADAERLVAEKACNAFNVRVSKVGGPLMAVEMARLAWDSGLTHQLGTQVGESDILTATARLVATSADSPKYRYLEGSGNRILHRHSLSRENLRVGLKGRARALAGPGIGIHVRRERLAELSSEHVVIDESGVHEGVPTSYQAPPTVTAESLDGAPSAGHGRNGGGRAMEAGVRAVMAVGQFVRWHTDAKHFEEATHDALGAQRAKLLSIVRQNQSTEYGREHNFAAIHDIAEFQRQVPINSYETLAPYIDRMADGEHNVLTAEDPLMFAVTSGTTGKQKMIPVTPSYLHEYNHALQVFMWRAVEDFPGGHVGQFLVTSSCDEEGHTSAGIPYGAMSGYVAKRQPALVRRRFALPYELSLVKDVELKYYMTLRLALESPLVSISTLNPSSVVLLCDKLQTHAERLIADIRAGTATGMGEVPEPLKSVIAPRLKPNPKRAAELEAILREHGELPPRVVWPKLVSLLCWKGGTMPLYLRQLRRWFGDLPTRDRGFMASEGCGSIPLANAGAGGALAITTHFYEFIPVDERESENPPVLTCDQLQPNTEYYILFTNSAGLYRYDINDIVRVVDYYHDVPVIEFVRKGRGMTSLTGEKLAESQVTAAMMASVEKLGLEHAVRHFTAVPEFGSPPRYSVLLEPSEALTREKASELARVFDKELYAQNVEYETKRESQRLGPPVLKLLAPGTYDAFRQKRVESGTPEAQFKVPHLTPDQSFGRDWAVVDEVS